MGGSENLKLLVQFHEGKNQEIQFISKFQNFKRLRPRWALQSGKIK